MALTPTEVNRTIKLRLDQQLADWNAANKTNLSIQQYLNTLTGLTVAARQSLLEKYNTAASSAITPPTTTQTIVQERLQQQVDDYNRGEGTNYTVEEYLDMLSKGTGVTISQKTVDILKEVGTEAGDGRATPSITPSGDEEQQEEIITPPQIRTIDITQAELDRVQQATDRGECIGAMMTYYTPTNYKVTLRDGSLVFVKSLSDEGAKQKAEDAGYDVIRVSKMFSWQKPENFYETTPAKTHRETEGGLIKLDTGEWVKEEFYNALPNENKNKLNDLGVDNYNQWLTDQAAIKVRETSNQYLIEAFVSGGLDAYNNAVEEYNMAIADVQWYSLYKNYKANADDPTFKDNWQWFQDTYSDKLDNKNYMNYLESDEFRDKYANVIQPSTMSDEDYNLIKPFITPEGFDSQAAWDASEGNPTKQVNIIRASREFTLTTMDSESRSKIDKGEWTLLPYGQIIETDTLEHIPPTYRNIVQNAGLVGYEAYQEKVLDWNKQEHWIKNTIDAITAQSVGLGQDIKNFALLQLTATYPEVQAGDTKPIIDPNAPQLASVGYVGFATPGIKTYTAEEAAELNERRADAQKYYKTLYDEAEMAAQEWLAQRPTLQPVYAEGFVDTVNKDPSTLKDPLLWTETIANTLPYTVATGLILGGAAGGPAGLAITTPLAFGITMSVEGHDIYKDAITHGASHDQALKLANTYGAISASIETLGDFIFVGVLGVGSGAFAQSLGKNVASNVVRGAAKKYGWKTLTVDMIKDFVNQGGQEFFQEVVHNAAIKTVDQNQALLENTANAFVSGVIGTAPFVLIPAGGQVIKRLETKIQDVRTGKADALSPTDITPQMQIKILNKVFAPVSGFTVKTTEAELEHIKKAVPEIALKGGPVEFIKRIWREKGRNIYEAGKNITVGLIDKKTVITGKVQVDEVARAYNEMSNRVNEYANTQLKLKQAQQAIADFGLAKSKSQLDTLNKYKERAAELEDKLEQLKDPMIESVRKFGDVFLKNSVGIEAEQKAEIREMSKTIVMDIDSVTTQLFGERDALEISKDIKELEGQIKVIEEEMAKGMTREQIEGYARLINILKGQIDDLVNELRLRYLAEGEKIKPDTKRLTMEVMSLQSRLIRAVADLQSFSGSVLNYDVYRKGELATKGEVVKMERDTFEAIQKTTKAIWGRESYIEVLEKLNRSLGDIISSMETLQAKGRATKAAFKIYDAIKKQDIKMLKEGVRLLQLEAGKIKDKPLQLQAVQQVKLLDTLTTENFWNRFKDTKPKKKADFTWYKSDDFESKQKDLIRKDAERIVARRLESILDKLPGYMRSWEPNAVMDYLREKYDRQYFQDVHFGKFEDLDDYLDADKEEARIRQEIERQEQLQTLQNNDIVEHEKERELTKGQLNKTTSPKMRGYLNTHLEEVERELDQKKKTLKTITKTKLVIPTVKSIETTKTQKERGVELATTEKEISAAERAKIMARAAQRINIAKQQIMKEGKKLDRAERNNASAFPGIRPKTDQDRKKERQRISHTLDDYLRTMTLAQAMKMYEDEAGAEQGVFIDTTLAQAVQTGIYAYTKAQTRNLTKTQIQTAVQTAVKTALEQQTKTATKEELETATKTVTEIITKTQVPIKTVIKPFLGKPEFWGKEKLPRVEPALAVWRQGMYYISIFPPFRADAKKLDIVYSRHKPPWGVKAKGRRSPSKSLRSIGKVPPIIEVPMGVVTARVKNGRKLIFSRRKRRRRVIS